MVAENTFSVFDPEVFARSEKRKLQVIFLTAEWCGTCIILEHIMNKLRKSYEPDVHFYKADYEIIKGWANQYGIFAPPALLYAYDHEVVDKDEGTVSGQEVVRKLDALARQYPN